jgi:hypothetical protein
MRSRIADLTLAGEDYITLSNRKSAECFLVEGFRHTACVLPQDVILAIKLGGRDHREAVGCIARVPMRGIRINHGADFPEWTTVPYGAQNGE